MTYAVKRDQAELIVIPLRYKNPTNRQEDEERQDTDWWDPVVVPFLCDKRRKINDNLILVGDIKVQLTASSPLSGFDSLTGAESCIIGHPKMQLRSVAVPSGKTPKTLTTTGACTEKNYSDSKAGALGDFHHYLGGLVVEEVNSKIFFFRQINADRRDGSFIDMDCLYTANNVKNTQALGLVMGDIHVDSYCPLVDKATFGKNGIVEILNPKKIVAHDVGDGYAGNPHHLGNPFISQAKFKAGRKDWLAEIKRTVDWLKEKSVNREVVVVPSNHNDFLNRWIQATDWRQDPTNAAFYLETAAVMVESAKMTIGGAEYLDPFEYWVNKLKGKSNVTVLKRNESLIIGGNECGLHGDKGPNGARGSLKNLSRLGVKAIAGHTHVPGIEEGLYQVGTSSVLRLEYTHGPSSWQNTHSVVYANGKRALITIIDGRWRL